MHLINPFAVSVNNRQYEIQQVTFKAIEEAWKHRGNIAVELKTAQFREDHNIIPPIFTRTPDLKRSVLDNSEFLLKRKLPFLSDILKRILKYSYADYAIFTNVDIIPSTNFYIKIYEILQEGTHAFTINRRTISEFPNTPDRLPEILDQEGTPHPGHDCFIFPRKWIKYFDVGNIVVGVPWIGFILLANIACLAKGVQVFQDLKITRHLGNDKVWQDKEHLQYRNYNAREAAEILDRLQQKYGSFKPDSYLGRHVTLAQQQVSNINNEEL